MFEMDNTVNQDETLFKAEICLCNKDRFGLLLSDFLTFEPIKKYSHFMPKEIKFLLQTQMF